MALIYKEEDFSEDLLALLNSDKADTKCTPEILKKIQLYQHGTLLRTTKRIGSPVEIIEVEELTEDNIF